MKSTAHTAKHHTLRPEEELSTARSILLRRGRYRHVGPRGAASRGKERGHEAVEAVTACATARPRRGWEPRGPRCMARRGRERGTRGCRGRYRLREAAAAWRGAVGSAAPWRTARRGRERGTRGCRGRYRLRFGRGRRAHEASFALPRSLAP